MTPVSLGDLSQTFLLKRQTAQVKQELQRLTVEMTTGKASDLTEKIGGDFSQVGSIERDLTALDTYLITTRETAILANAMQESLDFIQSTMSRNVEALIASANPDSEQTISIAAETAREDFGAVISALNKRVGDRTLFAGVGTDGLALADYDTFIADLTTATAGATDAASFMTALDTYFGAGGGFETTTYIGATTSLAPIQLDDDQAANLNLRADDDVLREALKTLAIGALLAEGQLAGDTDARAELMRLAGTRASGDEGKLTNLRARIGAEEARIDTALSRNEANASSLRIALAGLTDVDPYETATAITLAETQLESIYALTARLSRLSLTGYLR